MKKAAFLSVIFLFSYFFVTPTQQHAGYLSIRISRAAATTTPDLQFAAIAAKKTSTAPFAVSASSPSPGAITYSVVSGPATVSGNIVTLTGMGTVVLQASQAASDPYAAATATTTFSVSLAILPPTTRAPILQPVTRTAISPPTTHLAPLALPPPIAIAAISSFPVSLLGLVGYWPLDEGSGTTAFDRSGNGFNGTWQGAQAGTSGYYSGNAGSYSGTFDGMTTAVSFGSSIPIVTGPMTMSAWVQQTSLAAAGTYPLIFGNSMASLYVNPGSANVWAHLNIGGNDHYLGAGTPLSQWHLATVTYDGATMSFFLDGVLSGSGPASGPIGASGNPAIGGLGSWPVYPGLIDNVSFFNRALSATEVHTLYQSGRGVASAPQNVLATAGDISALVSFNQPLSNGGGAITSYTITASPGGLTASTSQATPTIVGGLSNGTAYSFTITATNAAGTSIPSAPSNVVTPAVAIAAIDWNDIHQVIDGFGASDAYTYLPLTPAQADLFFSPTLGVGLSLLRTAVPNDGSCTFVSTACAGAVSDMQLAAARGARIFSTPWSPPASMTSNGSTDCTVGPSPSYLLPSSYGAYASYLSNYIQSVQGAGVSLYALSIQNEPDVCASYGGAIWSDVALHDFIENNLGPTLAVNNQSATKIMLPEPGAENRLVGLADITMNDPAAAGYVGILAFHQYDDPSTLTNPWTASGKGFWETEVSGLSQGTSTLTLCNGCWDPSMQDALMWAQVMHRALAKFGVNAWNYWWLINDTNNDNEGLVRNGTVSKRLYMMGNYARFVRPGWTRIGATETPSPGIFVTAYKDPGSATFAIVAINTTSSSIPMSFAMNGVDIAGSVIPWVTSGVYNLEPQINIASTGGIFTATLTPASVTTYSGSVTP